MLLDFSVQNFRSIRESQTLSLVATKEETFENTHTVETELTGNSRVLRSAVLYGANASGKTNFLKAMLFFQQFVGGSFSRSPEAPTGYVPFFLDIHSVTQPGEMEITILLNGIKYQYGFRLDAQRVHEEWLLVYKTQKAQAWFERKFNRDTGKDEFQFSDKLSGSKKIWQEATRLNALFLSTAVQFNSEMLKPLYDWILTRPVFFWPDPFNARYTTNRVADPQFREKVLSFLKGSDIFLESIHVSPDTHQLLFQHKTDSGAAFFELADESLGTQRLFAMSGPILDILENGLFLFVDELDSSLHPLLVRRLLELFHDPKLNRNGAQILFTTHNTSLLDLKRFRRDQIWFVEKGASEASSLVPLSEYKIRKDLSVEKAYLEGRFGGVPVFPSLGI